ncbi:MAG: hypothetical protein WB697_11025 [Stellaceae bacterium]
MPGTRRIYSISSGLSAREQRARDADRRVVAADHDVEPDVRVRADLVALGAMNAVGWMRARMLR